MKIICLPTVEIPHMLGMSDEGSPKSLQNSPQVWHKLHVDLQHLVQWNANIRQVKLDFYFQVQYSLSIDTFLQQIVIIKIFNNIFDIYVYNYVFKDNI